MAARSQEARRQRKESRAQTKVAPLTTPQLSTPDARLSLVLEQIDRTRDVLNNDKFNWCPECKRGGVEPHHRGQLLRALASLLDQERILRSEPLPGSRRPGREKEPTRQPFARIVDDWEPRLVSPPPVEPLPG